MMRLHAVAAVLMHTKHPVYAHTRLLLLLLGLHAVGTVFDAYEVPVTRGCCCLVYVRL